MNSQKISRFLVYLIRLLHLIDKAFTNHRHNPNPKDLQDLTPKVLEIVDDAYIDTLKWALKNKNIRNIALTGPYGSGKSTLIKTFEHSHKEYTFMNISLASFREENGQKVDSKLIEQSILQQIFYKEKPQKLNNSRFKRIKKISWGYLVALSVLIILWTFSAMYFLIPEFITEHPVLSLFVFEEGILDLFTSVAFLVGLITIISHSIKFLKKTNFDKLNLAKGEFQVTPVGKSSILNKYLDEVIHFFEVTKYDVVAIEDLDRFNSEEIFTKLRELNLLINNSKQIGRKVVFIFAIKDDIFSKNSRTKFFDFIIPIIPIINSSNSNEILNPKLTPYSVSEDFLNDISLYIDDMRVLNNICNEFILYRGKLGDLTLKSDKLLGIIVYKNLYPKEFADLNLKKGLVYKTFANKRAIIRELTGEIDKEIEQIESDIQKIEETHLTNLRELRTIYLYDFIKSLPYQLSSFFVNNRSYSLSDIIDEFDVLTNLNDIHYDSPQAGRRSSKISFQALEKRVNPSKNYRAREKDLKLKLDGKEEKLKLELQGLKDQKNEVKSWSLKEVIEKRNPKNIFNDDLKKESLLVYLLRNGYIDEMYESYVSYFYEGSLTRTDKDFVINVKDRISMDFNYQLNKIDEVIKRLSELDFKREESLNVTLINYLLSNKATYQTQLQSILLQIANKTERGLEFFDAYSESGTKLPEFINQLCNRWPAIWKYITNDPVFTQEKKDRFLKLIIQHSDLGRIETLDIDYELSSYIEKKSAFLFLLTDDQDIEKIKTVISTLKIKFEDLERPFPANELFDYVYEGNYYQINLKMLKLIIAEKSKGNTENEELEFANYTTILKSGCQQLVKYIDENIETYLDNVFLELEHNTQESEDAIIKLLNHEEISDTKVEEVLEKEIPQISDMSNIDKSIWHFLFSADKIKASWSNVIRFFEDRQEFEASMTHFLNKPETYLRLSKERIDKEKFKSEVLSEFQQSLILSTEISLESFKNLMKAFNTKYDVFAIESLTKEKVAILIDYKILTLTEMNYTGIEETFPELKSLIIERNVKEYLKHVDSFEISSDDLYRLLISNRIRDKQKLQIINNLKGSDILYQDKKVGNELCKFYVRQKSEVLEFPLLKSIILNSKSYNDCIPLFNMHYHRLNKEEITELLKALGGSYSKILSRGLKPKISKNQNNLNLVRNLKESNYVSSFKILKDKIQIFTFTGK